MVGMEEVHKYANAANYLLESFGLDDRAHVNAASNIRTTRSLRRKIILMLSTFRVFCIIFPIRL